MHLAEGEAGARGPGARGPRCGPATVALWHREKPGEASFLPSALLRAASAALCIYLRGYRCGTAIPYHACPPPACGRIRSHSQLSQGLVLPSEQLCPWTPAVPLPRGSKLSLSRSRIRSPPARLPPMHSLTHPLATRSPPARPPLASPIHLHPLLLYSRTLTLTYPLATRAQRSTTWRATAWSPTPSASPSPWAATCSACIPRWCGVGGLVAGVGGWGVGGLSCMCTKVGFA